MPLDRIRGEIVGDLGHAFRIVANAKWRETPLFDEAAQKAAQAFLSAGALWPVTFDDGEVLTQEYPSSRQLVIIFSKSIKGVETLFPWVWDLPDKMLAELKTLGKWDDQALQ